MSISSAESQSDRSGTVAAAPTRRLSDHAWILVITALSLTLGALLALAIRTTDHFRESDAPGSRLGVSTAFLARYKDQNLRLQNELVDLRHSLNNYISGVKDDSRATEDLKRQFEELKVAGGLAEVVGPGLKITVRDSTEPLAGEPPGEYLRNIVHDQDLNSLIGELKAAGAKALAISGADTENLQRIIVTTTARCAGSTAVVNGTPLSAPYRILAVGDPKQLRAALDRPDGYVHERKLDVRKMISIEDANSLRIPEYSGTLSPRYARAVTESEKP
jgi:uncharacterized protein YlxW (UPF0749 family)